MRRIILCIILISGMTSSHAQYTMPIETDEHEGTWLQWPHNYTYPPFNREDLEDTWVAMTRELVNGEKVHIIAYDNEELDYIIGILSDNGVPLNNVDFLIKPTDDVWVRDNGPIYVYDQNNSLHILDWGFNGWGGDTPFELCNTVPAFVANNSNIPLVDLNEVILEGGAIEIDGAGTLMATRSSILEDDRNPDWTESQIENFIMTNLGVTNFIWLDGVHGLEITDMHIDGFARFHDAESIVTMSQDDLTYWEVPANDISTLMNASNANGQTYSHIILPLTQNNVTTTWGDNLGYKGSYVNYYVANGVVLVPTYNDPNDMVAISILQNLYPNKSVVGIDVRNLYAGGGMVHCVTQQQPIDLTALAIEFIRFDGVGKDCTIELGWEMSGGLSNIDKILIERSENSTEFIGIGEILEENLNGASNIFSFIDPSPELQNYYRLSLYNINGAVKFSPVIGVKNACIPDSFRVHPTIVDKQATISIKSAVNGRMEIMILSVGGKVIKKTTIEKQESLLELSLETNDLANGTYFVKIISDQLGEIDPIKIMVAH